MKKVLIGLFMLSLCAVSMAQNGKGGLTTEDLNKIKAGYEKESQTKNSPVDVGCFLVLMFLEIR